MPEFDVLIKIRVSGTKAEATKRITDLIDQLDGADDPFMSVVDAVIEEPIRIRNGRKK